jgi:hypothetical protein
LALEDLLAALPHGNKSTDEADEMIECLKDGVNLDADDCGGSLDDEGAWFMRIGDTTWVGVEGTVLWPPSRTAATRSRAGSAWCAWPRSWWT